MSAPKTAPVSHVLLKHWQGELARHWQKDAQLQPVGGFEDQNFLVLEGGKPVAFWKVMHAGCAPSLVEMQVSAFGHLAKGDNAPNVPRILCASSGEPWTTCTDPDGKPRPAWMMSLMEGKLYADAKPHGAGLLASLGESLAQLDISLEGFEHSELTRPWEWNLEESGWICDRLDLIEDPKRQALITEIHRDFVERLSPALAKLPHAAIHGDGNDYNVFVQPESLGEWRVSGWIDFGDMVWSAQVCDLAVTCAYAVLGQAQPLRALEHVVAAYHGARPLSEAEIDVLYGLMRLRLASSVAQSAKARLERPDDPYVVISEAPAWEFLERSQAWHDSLVRVRLRMACGMPAFPHSPGVHALLEEMRGECPAVLGRDLNDVPRFSWAVQDVAIPRDPRHLDPSETTAEDPDDDSWTLGGYLEPRLVYTEPAYRSGDHEIDGRRTVHLGADLFAPAGTEVHAPIDSKVYAVEDRDQRLDYGGMVLLQHATAAGETFFTLYGHLDPASVRHLKPGQPVPKGQAFARLGTRETNGGWIPHLHFQVAMTTDGLGQDWPAVCVPDDVPLWREVCPNPAGLLNLPDERLLSLPKTPAQTLRERSEVLGANVRLSYREPVGFVRGFRHYLYDAMGRAYLDAYNNVPHVGHCHPRIQAVYAHQTAMLNTNTRYLSDAQADYAKRLLAMLPDRFSKCFFVNSGSEANELAVRLARAFTGQRGMLVQDHGYHGNTNVAVELSPYKFNGPGGSGPADYVAVCQVADTYRGPFGPEVADAGERFAVDADRAIAELKGKGFGLAACILECFPSVGGQLIPPPGYLAGIFRRTREAGGICIADEVQTGLARLGRYRWAFEHQQAEPDIVVLGKPIGNGHPMGVVITTDEIAASFDNGMEFFSTFGGSTLSCRIGCEVLDIVRDENLADNSERVGAQLLAGFERLAGQHPAIGDVRGLGLFLGVELVTDRETKEPATDWASYVANRMRQERILIGTDGPHGNVLKIRPPMSFASADAERLLKTLHEILCELP